MQISEAAREHRELVAKLRGRLFPAEELPRHIVYGYCDKPRLSLAQLPAEGKIPLRSDRPLIVNPARTTLKPR
jgi:hypothetical protein